MIYISIHIALFFALFLSSTGQTERLGSRKENYIDSIQNAKQITELISSIDSPYRSLAIKDELKVYDTYCMYLFDSLKAKLWSKADFDNNGKTDLLVVGSSLRPMAFCILAMNDRYEIKLITRALFEACTIPIIEDNKIACFKVAENNHENNYEQPKLKKTTLTYKYGGFIEENQKPAKHKIKRVEYSTTRCYGSCPMFSMKISSNRKAVWNAMVFNEVNDQEVEGEFYTTITEDKYNDPVNLLNYIDFARLQKNYTVGWMHNQSSTLVITYDNARVKIIHDYGLMGSYGLARLNELLFELRENQEWSQKSSAR